MERGGASSTSTTGAAGGCGLTPVVDQSDVVAVTSNMGPCEDPDNCPWDVNGDGVVDGSDVQAVATHFGPCP